MSNYVVPEADAIAYEMKPTGNGWILSVKVPAATSVQDQDAILSWIHKYQRDVKQLHPHWLTAFRETGFGYILLIEKAEGPREMLRAVGLMQSGNLIRDYWSRSLEYAG